MMDLHYYPLDHQNCTVEIESCKCSHYRLDGVNASIMVNDLIAEWNSEPDAGNSHGSGRSAERQSQPHFIRDNNKM